MNKCNRKNNSNKDIKNKNENINNKMNGKNINIKYKELKCREINVNGYNKNNKWKGELQDPPQPGPPCCGFDLINVNIK